MDVSIQKRMAADVAGVGKDRIWIDPTKLEEVSKALTKDDIRVLIEKGVIKVLPVDGQTRYWARVRHLQRKKGRRRSHGRRKGAQGARTNKKEEWINKIRALRRLLRTLKQKGKIDRKLYRKLYMMCKGGYFRSRSHLLFWLKERRYIE